MENYCWVKNKYGEVILEKPYGGNSNMISFKKKILVFFFFFRKEYISKSKDSVPKIFVISRVVWYCTRKCLSRNSIGNSIVDFFV